MTQFDVINVYRIDRSNTKDLMKEYVTAVISVFIGRTTIAIVLFFG